MCVCMYSACVFVVPCVGCSEGFFGDNCREACLCQNGAACHFVTGECSCTVGWNGTYCDRREHTLHTHVRDSPSICDSTSLLRGQGARHPWSVSCLLSAPPAACDQGFYGQGCSEVCVCETGYCNPMNGTCTCEPGYFGADCAHSESRSGHITHTHTHQNFHTVHNSHAHACTYVH